MYAVIKAGGKQHRVRPGDVIEVELMKGLDDTVTFHPILVVDDEGKTHHGTDIERAVVTAKPLGEQKGDKVRIFKYKNKSGYARRQGHRQTMTLLEISDVSLGGAAPRKTVAKKPVEAGAEATEAAE
jgi:large subunit ribosomal protein L21